MKPQNFPEANTLFAENQPEYETQPAFTDKKPEGEVITCWKLSFMERMTLLFTGKLWLSFLTFHRPLFPSFMTVKKSDLFEGNSKKS